MAAPTLENQPDLEDYNPVYIDQDINAGPKKVISNLRWNELFNLLIEQGDYNAKTLDLLIENININGQPISPEQEETLATLDATALLTTDPAIVVETLSADKAYISELNVDQLDTSDKVRNYLALSTADVNYIKIVDQFIYFIEATTDGSSTEHAQDRNSNDLYWTADPDGVDPYGVTTEVTAWPVTQYVYTEVIKTELAFKDVGGLYTPVFTLGAGTGVGSNGKAFIRKGLTGLEIFYYTSTGTLKAFTFGDDGTYISGTTPKDIQMYDDGMVVTYDDDAVDDMSITKDGEGRITQIVNHTKLITTDITYNVGAKP